MQTVSKNIIKHIQSLAQRKFRRQEGLFVAEGNKLVGDNLNALQCQMLFATSEWYAANPSILSLLPPSQLYQVSPSEMERLSLQPSPQEVLGVFTIPHYILPSLEEVQGELSLVLDTIQDPGNLGTIIRLCDWFGIRHIFCSPETADCFAPKVVQATMGAIARVQVHYLSLESFLAQAKEQGMPIYGTYLEGENLYQTALSTHGLLIMGNEGRGISPAIAPFVSHKLNIPSHPAGQATSESLNVGIATAIAVAEFRRRLL